MNVLIMDTRFKFSRTTVSLHWLVALVIICLLIVGFYMSRQKVFWLYDYHKSMGVLVFVVALTRVVWRYKNGWPIPLGRSNKLQQFVAKAVHWFILAASVMMPLSGMFNSGFSGHGFGILGLELVPSNVVGDNFIPYNQILARLGRVGHKLLGYLLVLAILLHVAGALKHHLIDRDGTLQRMLGKNISA